jgi:glycosyltransferase involved in cell wall biosynthesis
MQKPGLRIFVDCHVFDGPFQGTTTYLRGLYTELIKNTDIEFFLAASDVAHLAEIFGTAPNLHYLAYKKHNKFYRLLIDIPRMIKQHRIDYAHFQYIVPPVKHCKYIVTLHDVIFMEYPEYFPLGYRIKNGLLFKHGAKKADILLTISDYSAQQIKKHLGLAASAIIHNTAEDVFFDPYDKSACSAAVAQKFGINNYWLYVSRREPRKNHHGLLKAFAEGGFYNNYSLVFVGSRAIQNPEYDALYSSLPAAVQQKVVSFEKINFTDLLLLMRGARLAVYPSVAEGFGIPPLEAVAAQVPVACSGATAMADFTFLSDTLFDPYDTGDMIAKINTALQQTPARLETIRQGLKNQYSWQKGAAIVKGLLAKADALKN